MVAVTEFNSDYELSDKINDEGLDLVFLEVSDTIESLFGMDVQPFDVIAHMTTKKTFIPSLHETVFEEPLRHAMWSGAWPHTTRRFPS